MRGCTSLVDPYPPPTRVLGGRGTPSHFPHGFGLGAGVRGSPLPHTTAMMWYAQIWCDTMWFTVLYFIDIMWKYVKIYESLKYVKTCQNNVMCKHVLPWSSSNVTHLSTIHGSISFLKVGVGAADPLNVLKADVCFENEQKHFENTSFVDSGWLSSSTRF